jgi:hypothetical protein
MMFETSAKDNIIQEKMDTTGKGNCTSNEL